MTKAYQPPPTHSPPYVYDEVEVKTVSGATVKVIQPTGRFDTMWLHWFLKLVADTTGSFPATVVFDNANLLGSAKAFGSKFYQPDIRSGGAGATVTRDAQGFIITVPSPSDVDMVLAASSFGRRVFADTDTSAAASFDSDQNILANQVFGA